MADRVRLGSRPCGDGEPCWIVFEIGATHDGVDTARRLIDHAAEAGADAVKFQMIDPDRLVARREMTYTYTVLADRETGATDTVTERQYDILARRALAADEWAVLKRHADALGLAFFLTVFWDDEIELARELGCQSLKIASGDVNTLPFIRRAARSGLCIQLDTGNASLGEIEAAVDVIRSEGNKDIIIHQCPSGYPARLDGINLRVVRTLKQMFHCPAAFSDHSPGWDMDVAAVALGANLVEKTVTLDRTTRSVEHIMSLEPPEMKQFVRLIRSVETALGAPRRILKPEERESRLQFRRSAYLAEPARRDQKVSDVAVIFRRPGDGIGGDVYETLVDHRFREDLSAGHRLSLADLRDPEGDTT